MPDNLPPDDDDDDELELEPVDADVLEIERQRGQRKTDEAIAKADVDELYEERGHADLELNVDWSKLREFRFTTRHLLILTAVLAIGLTLFMRLGVCMGIFAGALVAIGVGWFTVYRVEKREANERARRREEFFATRGASGEASTTSNAEPWVPEPTKLSEFKFAFSLKELLITMAVAAVVLALLTVLGGQVVTISLGIIAFIGLAVQAFGLYDPPPIIVLGWWLMLVMYLVLGLLTAYFPSLMGATP